MDRTFELVSPLDDSHPAPVAALHLWQLLCADIDEVALCTSNAHGLVHAAMFRQSEQAGLTTISCLMECIHTSLATCR